MALAPARADDSIGHGPAASWVEELPIPKPRPARLRQVQDGIYYLLSDSQIRPEGGNETFFRRNVYLVTDRNGLEEAARVDIDYDPMLDHVVLNRMRVIRGGKSYDRLPGANIRTMERESDSDNGVFDGLKTVHVEIKDVAVGDIVDVAYSWESKDAFWPGEFFGSTATQWSVPLEELHYRLLWPTDRPLAIRGRATDLKPVTTRDGAWTSYDWTSIDAEPVPGEDGTPDWYPTWGSISISSMTRWSQVVAWAMPFYTVPDTLPPALEARVDAIARKFPRAEDRITEAMRLVEDELRYVSMSIGANSYRPRSPAEVFASGYGDCKDKSALLVVLLKRLGVEAHVALTDTKNGPVLPQLAPAANVFDHAIVQVRLAGRSYWIDPTSAHAGGRFPDIAPVDYGYALPIAPGQDRLERMPTPHLAKLQYRTVEHYTLTQGPRPSLALRVTTVYAGAEADAMRSTLVSKSQAKLESDYLAFYAGLYPGILRDKPLSVSDDRDRNLVVTTEAYHLPADALRRGKLLKRFPVKASSLDAYDKIPNGTRRTPYQLQTGIDREQVIVLDTPGRRPPAPQPVAIDGKAFRYALDVSRAGDTLTLSYRLIGDDDAVLKASDVPGAASDADTINEDNYWYLDLTSTAGGTIGDDPAAWWRTLALSLLALFVATVLAGGAVFAVRHGLLADDAHAHRGVFYPVRPGKFLAMSAATAGLYAVFWMWKCWRWYGRNGHPDIQPFWRALFAVFWLPALLREVRARGAFSARMRFAAAFSSFGYAAWIAGFAVLAANPQSAVLVAVGEALSFVWIVPAVLAVNRLNAGCADIVAANSRASDLTGLAVAGGLLAWAVLLVPALMLGPWRFLGAF